MAELPADDQWHECDALVVVGIRPGTPLTDATELTHAATAAGRSDLPILALLAQEMPATTQDTVTVRSYPVSLADLSDWLAHIPAAAESVPVSV